MIKALAMTAALTTVATGLEFVLCPFPLSRHWLADELPLIVGIGFSASLFVGAILGFRRVIGGQEYPHPPRSAQEHSFNTHTTY